MDWGSWHATVHRDTKSRMQLKRLSMCAQTLLYSAKQGLSSIKTDSITWKVTIYNECRKTYSFLDFCVAPPSDIII